MFNRAVEAVSRPGPTLRKIASGIVDNPVRYAMALGTGGLSEAARAVPGAGRVFSVTDAIGNKLQTMAADSFTGGYYGKGRSMAQNYLNPNSNQGLQFLGTGEYKTTGDDVMALNLGGILAPIFGLMGNTSNPYAQSIGQIGSAFAGAYNQPRQPSYAMPQQVVQAMPVSNAGVPMIRPPGQARGLTKEVFDAGVKVLGRLGVPFSASPSGFSSALKRSLGSIASLARRTPSGTMVGLLVGLGLSAFEGSLLTVWHSQRKRGRRMNPANAKALRRSVRRIKSFHKLCQSTDIIKSRSRTSSRSRCGTCRKSPCKC